MTHKSQTPRRLRSAALSAIAASAAALGWVAAAAPARAADVSVSKAWVPPVEKAGGDVVLSATIANAGADADALLRASCPFANFSEKRTIDHGEGAPSTRAIPNIPVPAKDTLVLAATGYHVALLQTREPLAEGADFTCSLSFRKAGPVEVKVRVARRPPSD